MGEGLFGVEKESKGPSDAQFGRYNAGAGRAGEDFYDRGLANAGIKDSYSTYRSRSIPTPRGEKQFSGDIDFVEASESAVLLTDVKKWAGGHHYWSFGGRGFKDLQPALRDKDGRPKLALSKNMELAMERYRSELPSDIRVHGIVVFVPADGRNLSSVPRSVRFLIWPGGVRSYLAAESYDVIERVLGEPSKAREDVDQLLKRWRK